MSGAGRATVYDRPLFCHDLIVRDAGARVGQCGFDAGAEPGVIFRRVFGGHEVRRRIEVRGGEAFEVWRIVGHGGGIAEGVIGG